MSETLKFPTYQGFWENSNNRIEQSNVKEELNSTFPLNISDKSFGYIIYLNLLFSFICLTLPGLGFFENLKAGGLVGPRVISPEWDMLET